MITLKTIPTKFLLAALALSALTASPLVAMKRKAENSTDEPATKRQKTENERDILTEVFGPGPINQERYQELLNKTFHSRNPDLELLEALVSDDERINHFAKDGIAQLIRRGRTRYLCSYFDRMAILLYSPHVSQEAFDDSCCDVLHEIESDYGCKTDVCMNVFNQLLSHHKVQTSTIIRFIDRIVQGRPIPHDTLTSVIDILISNRHCTQTILCSSIAQNPIYSPSSLELMIAHIIDQNALQTTLCSSIAKNPIYSLSSLELMIAHIIDQNALKECLNECFFNHVCQSSRFTAYQFAYKQNRKTIKFLLQSPLITSENINNAFVRAASDGNVALFDLLRKDHRIQNTSPFPLDECLNCSPEMFHGISVFLDDTTKKSLACTQTKMPAIFDDHKTLAQQANDDHFGKILGCYIDKKCADKALKAAIETKNIASYNYLLAAEHINFTPEAMEAALALAATEDNMTEFIIPKVLMESINAKLQRMKDLHAQANQPKEEN